MFFALAFHNKLEYFNVNVRIKSNDDTSCTNLVGVGLVTPKITVGED